MKKMLQIISVIGLISVNIGYANWWQDYQNYLKRQQIQNIPTEKQIQVTPVQKANWLTRLKQWFTPTPGPEYRELPIIKTGNIDIQTGEEEKVLLLPFAKGKELKKQTYSIGKGQQLEQGKSYKIEEMGIGRRKKYYLRTIPSSKSYQAIDLSKEKPEFIKPTTSGVEIPLQNIKKGKTYVTPGWWTYEVKSFEPTSKIYPKKTEELFKKYGGGWE